MNTIHKFTMAIVAVVMIAGFSAFKMGESNEPVNNQFWYALDPSGNIGSAIQDGDNCLTDAPIYCAIGFFEDPGTEVPTHVDEVDEEDAEIRYKFM